MMRPIPARCLAVLVYLVAAGCAPGASSRPAPQASVPCSPVDLLRAPPGQWLPDPASNPRAAVPPLIRRSFASATTLDTVDLDCDGARDWLGAVSDSADLLPRVEGAQLQAVAAFVRRGAGWERVLFAPIEDGAYLPILAAGLAGGGRRDLVFLWEYDSGYTPVVFRWTSGRYTRVRLPGEYALSGYKGSWEMDCMKLIRPAPAAGGGLRLMRETGAPESAGCLPLDVVRVAGDSVVVVRAGG